MATALGAVNGMAGLALRRSVAIAVPVDEIAGASRLPSGPALEADALIAVRVEDPSTAQTIWSALRDAPIFVVVLAILAILLVMVRDARRTDPFTERTVRRLRWLGAWAIVGGSVVSLLESFAMAQLSHSVTDGAVAVWELPGLWFAVGSGFLALSAVINKGRAMRTELDEVI